MKINKMVFYSLLVFTTGIVLSIPASGLEPVEMTVAEKGFAALYFDPPKSDKSIGLIVLGGSEGGHSVRQAEAFAAEGFPVISLAYFKVPGTPDFLDEVPLEYFDKPLDWFANQDSMRGKKIVLVGGSKGAELALLLAARKKSIGGVVGLSPSSVVFQGIPKVFWPPRSSWSSNGEPIPFVPYDASQGVDPRHLRPLYELSLASKEKVKQAIIPVEQISGPILLFSGEADTMWPASEMADALIDRLKSHEFPHAYEHVKYENAGHTLNEFYMIGGTKEGNKKARTDSWQRMLSFLSDKFQKAEK